MLRDPLDQQQQQQRWGGPHVVQAQWLHAAHVLPDVEV